MVAEGVPEATQALLSGDNEAYLTLAERDRAINALYIEMEGLANREILLQAPVAADLRFLLSVLRDRARVGAAPTTSWCTSPPGPVTSSSDDLSPRAPGVGGADGRSRVGHVAAGGGRWYQRDRAAAAALAERDEGWTNCTPASIAELASGQTAIPVTMEMAWSRGTTSGSAHTRSTSPAAWSTWPARPLTPTSDTARERQNGP